MEKTSPKVAVVLYGFLRTYKRTCNSLIKHILKPYNADLFIFAPDNTGYMPRSTVKSHETKIDGDLVSERDLMETYGKYLKSYRLWKYSKEIFYDKINDLSKGPIIAGIHPDRICSMFYHIKQSIELLQGEYDLVILTRADLAFYSMPDLSKLDINSINISQGEGFDYYSGRKNYGNAVVFYYKNMELAEAIPAEQYSFCDQIIIGSASNIKLLQEIYENLLEYCVNRLVPCNPETLIYYHLALQRKLPITSNKEFCFEIVRDDMPDKQNVATLPIHPVISKWKRLYNKIIHKLFG